MDETVCKKCGGLSTRIEPRGMNNAHVCAECGTYIRWAKKGELPIEVEAPGQKPCPYCDQEYVIPSVFDGGITAWENIEAKYCPICGRQR
jgi:hypothetical protein